jgi:hypothetical protein
MTGSLTPILGFLFPFSVRAEQPTSDRDGAQDEFSMTNRMSGTMYQPVPITVVREGVGLDADEGHQGNGHDEMTD